MQNSKLIVFFKTMSSAEMKDFGRFIEGQSSKSSNDLVVFFDYLKKCHPTFPAKKIEKVRVAQKVFPKEPNNQKKVINVMYKLGQLLTDFLIQDELKSQNRMKDFLILEALKKRKLDKYFFKKIDQLEEEWQKESEGGIEHLHDLYSLKKTRFLHPNYAEESNMSLGPRTLLQHIDQYYLAVKLYWNLCDYHTTNYVANTNEQIEDCSIERLLEFMPSHYFSENPQINLLDQILKVFNLKKFEHYPVLKKDFLQNFHLYSKDEKIDLFAFLNQICYEYYKQGESKALIELFELNKFAVEKQIFLEDGYIASDIFQNIVNIACVAQELDWAEKFIEDFSVFLREDQQADATSLCKAILFFNKQNYENVLEMLVQLKFHNTFYGVQARAITLKAYYELEGYEESFNNLTKSFRLFLYRNQFLAENAKKSFGNFIDFVTQLEREKHHYEIDLETLSKKIRSCDEIVYKSWLLEKVRIAQEVMAQKHSIL